MDKVQENKNRNSPRLLPSTVLFSCQSCIHNIYSNVFDMKTAMKTSQLFVHHRYLRPLTSICDSYPRMWPNPSSDRLSFTLPSNRIEFPGVSSRRVRADTVEYLLSRTIGKKRTSLSLSYRTRAFIT